MLPKLLLLTTLLSAIQAARILAVIPTVSKSHYGSARNILIELAKRHDLVVMSAYEETDPPKGWSWVPIKIKGFEDAVPSADHNVMDIEELSFFDSQKRLWSSMNEYTDYVTNLTEVRQFIEKDNSAFDLVLIEEFFQQAFYTFAFKYNAPLVLLSSFGSAHYISEYLGNAVETSYVPHEFAFSFGEMSLIERAKNLIYTVYDFYGRRYYSLEHQNELSRMLFGIKNAPHVKDIEKNADLVLFNSHFSLNGVQPYLPNMIDVAGVHIDEVKPLDEKYKMILDNAKHGVVLFSFGSLVELAKFPKELATQVLNALGRVKQEVFVKWNSDETPPVSFKNVHTFKWLPQNDILAHPNLVAFVTHGGLMSSQEAIHHGVPSICIPFFGDQPHNCQRSVKLSYGIHLSKTELTEDALYEKLQTLLTDDRYKNTVRSLSNRFKDRPMKALDTAIFWIEYVIRHKGEDFLKSPKRNMSWIQILYLDLAVMFLISFLFVRMVIRNLYEITFRRSKVKIS